MYSSLPPSLHFLSYLFPENVPGKHRKWHFWDYKLKNILGEYTSTAPLAPLRFFECINLQNPGCKESHFYSLPFGQAEANILTETSFQLAPKTFWWAELTSQFFCNLNSTKNFTCPLGKLRTEFTSPIAISTSPGLSDTTFFSRWNLTWRPCTYSVGYHYYHSHEGKKSHEQWQGCLTI